MLKIYDSSDLGKKAKNRKEEGLVLEDTKIYNKITTTKFIHY